MEEIEKDFVDEQGPESNDDKYVYEKMISELVRLGYGNYKESANAEIIEAVKFLYINKRETVKQKVREHLKNGK